MRRVRAMLKSGRDRYAALRRLAKQEMGSPARLRHPRAWPLGFTSDRYELYQLRSNNPLLYVSDLDRMLRASVNHASLTPILKNKLIFQMASGNVCNEMPDLVSELAGVVVNGEYVAYAGSSRTVADATCLVDVVEGLRAVVIKPIDGFGGRNVHLLELTSDGLFLDFALTNAQSVEAWVSSLDGYVVVRRLQPAGYSAEVFGQSLNTLRIPTFRDVHTNDPFIPVAIHRFGVKASAPTDNFSQGGLSCEVDLNSAVLGPGLALGSDGRLRSHNSHPDTEARLSGREVPCLHEACELALGLANAFPYFSAVGWDFALSTEGLKLIEGNHHMGVVSLQPHKALLSDDRVRAFYVHHQALGRRRLKYLTRRTASLAARGVRG